MSESRSDNIETFQVIFFTTVDQGRQETPKGLSAVHRINSQCPVELKEIWGKKDLTVEPVIAKLSTPVVRRLLLLLRQEKEEQTWHTRLCMRGKKRLIFMVQLIGLWSPLADRISLNHRWCTPRKELVIPSSPLRAEDGRKVQRMFHATTKHEE